MGTKQLFSVSKRRSIMKKNRGESGHAYAGYSVGSILLIVLVVLLILWLL
jgi:hypothetical protein